MPQIGNARRAAERESWLKYMWGRIAEDLTIPQIQPSEEAGVPIRFRHAAEAIAAIAIVMFLRKWSGTESNRRHGDFQPGPEVRKIKLNQPLAALVKF
jgi:hypothetical protein